MHSFGEEAGVPRVPGQLRTYKLARQIKTLNRTVVHWSAVINVINTFIPSTIHTVHMSVLTQLHFLYNYYGCIMFCNHNHHTNRVLRALLCDHDGLILLAVELQETLLVTEVFHLRSPHHRLHQVSLHLTAVTPCRLVDEWIQSFGEPPNSSTKTSFFFLCNIKWVMNKFNYKKPVPFTLHICANKGRVIWRFNHQSWAKVPCRPAFDS